MAAVQVVGLRELRQAMGKLSGEVNSTIARKAVGAGARVVKTAVRNLALIQPTLADAPYVHGDFVYQPGHVGRNVIAKGLSDVEFIVAVRSNKQNGYAGRIASFNEFGTVKMAPQPFMRPGFELSKNAAVDAIAEALENGIAKAAR